MCIFHEAPFFRYTGADEGQGWVRAGLESARGIKGWGPKGVGVGYGVWVGMRDNTRAEERK